MLSKSPYLPAVADLLPFNPDKPISLPGARCAYCGCEIGGRTSTNDHVVARRFVPQGTLAGFNLKVKACRQCNDQKARLEDDISIITMLPDTAGRYARDDERLVSTVKRKAQGAISPTTRRLVAKSYNRFDLKFPLGSGASLSWSGLAMPTLDDTRVAELAYYHVQGFSFFRSYDVARRHGSWLRRGNFLMLGQLIDADWGNPRLRHFTSLVRAWEPCCILDFADGYFRHAMFRSPDAEVWGWALEWNCRLRLFGLYGEAAAREPVVTGMPNLAADLSQGDTTNGFIARIDTPLGEGEDDVLFEPPGGVTDLPFATPHWR